jgi:branched-chain amino acid transport system ATP-binding protein
MILEVKELTKNFGGVLAVDSLDFKISRGEIVGLIGPNGSGKSTTINLVCGLFSATGGTVSFLGKDLKNLSADGRVAEGIARTFQNIRLFNELTVWQNLLVSWNDVDSNKSSWSSRWFGNLEGRKNKISDLLRFSGLEDKENQLAGNLSFGEQRRLEMARAIASKPQLILLDEPAAGMNSQEISDLGKRIFSLRDSGITILLVEHVMELVMNVADRIIVLNFGKKIAEGAPKQIRDNETVQEAYFGSETE